MFKLETSSIFNFDWAHQSWISRVLGVKKYPVLVGNSEIGTWFCNILWNVNHEGILQGVSLWRMQSKSVLRGRRINNFIELWCLVASGDLEICVSSTSFQKNDIGWPQQPLTEKVLKFNMIFHDSTPNFFFRNIKIKLTSNAWMTLKSSVVIFQASETLLPQWPLQPQQPPWPQWPLQPHFFKKITASDGWIMDTPWQPNDII